MWTAIKLLLKDSNRKSSLKTELSLFSGCFFICYSKYGAVVARRHL
ncbi:hypothetical protein [Kingella negevensis]|nr:hypothetical protein [Kingella negevensis]MDK4689579.1 hypothetical protein [Kingella negevensis]